MREKLSDIFKLYFCNFFRSLHSLVAENNGIVSAALASGGDDDLPDPHDDAGAAGMLFVPDFILSKQHWKVKNLLNPLNPWA